MSWRRKRGAEINNRKNDRLSQKSWCLWKKAKEKHRNIEKVDWRKYTAQIRKTRTDRNTWYVECFSCEDGGILSFEESKWGSVVESKIGWK